MMRAGLYSSSCSLLPATPELRFCHLSLSSSLLKSPLLLPQKHHQSLQNSHLSLKPKLEKGPITIVTSSSMASTQSANRTEKETKPFSVLFVCLGNICRSPAAEGVFTDLVKKRGLNSNFLVDSAGTIDYHEGKPADPRMRAASKRRGIEITSISRPVKPSISKNLILFLQWISKTKDILASLERWSFRETLPGDAYKKVRLMCSYCKKHDETEVPDPYYGGPQGFEKFTTMHYGAWSYLLRVMNHLKGWQNSCSYDEALLQSSV